MDDPPPLEVWVSIGIRIDRTARQESEPRAWCEIRVAALGIARSRRAAQMMGIRRMADFGLEAHEEFSLRESPEETLAAFHAWLKDREVPVEFQHATIQAMANATRTAYEKAREIKPDGDS